LLRRQPDARHGERPETVTELDRALEGKLHLHADEKSGVERIAGAGGVGHLRLGGRMPEDRSLVAAERPLGAALHHDPARRRGEGGEGFHRLPLSGESRHLGVVRQQPVDGAEERRELPPAVRILAGVEESGHPRFLRLPEQRREVSPEPGLKEV